MLINISKMMNIYIIWVSLLKEISKLRKVGIKSHHRGHLNHVKSKEICQKTTLYLMQEKISSTNPQLIFSMTKFLNESWTTLRPIWSHSHQASQRKRVIRKKHLNFLQNKNHRTRQPLIMKEIYSLQWQPGSKQSKRHAKTNVNR